MDEKRVVSIFLEEWVIAELDQIAKQRGLGRSTIVRELIMDWLRERAME